MHFTCAVFTNTNNMTELESLMAPYCEGDEAFFEFVPCPGDNPDTDEATEEWGMVKEGDEWGYMENPNAQWDYYAVEKKPSSFKASDFTNNAELTKEAETFWDEYVLGNEKEKYITLARKKAEFLHAPEWYLKNYTNKECYVKIASCIDLPYAILTPDGVWHSEEEMLRHQWSDFWHQCLNTYQQNACISLVNCHI